jgi:hypothetical protein
MYISHNYRSNANTVALVDLTIQDEGHKLDAHCMAAYNDVQPWRVCHHFRLNRTGQEPPLTNSTASKTLIPGT